MTGTVALFLPLTWRYSPLQAVAGPFAQAALPAFLAPVASLASVRCLWSGALSRVEREVAYVVAASMAAVTLSTYWSIEWPDNVRDVVAHALPVVILCWGAYAMAGNARSPSRQPYNPVVALQCAYVAHAVLALVGATSWDAGAYLVLLAAMAFATQMVLVSRGQRRRRARNVARAGV